MGIAGAASARPTGADCALPVPRSWRRRALEKKLSLGVTREMHLDTLRQKALAAALVRTGRKPQEANALAREVVGGIQGALVLARAFDQTDVFTDALASLQERLLTD